MALPDKLKSPKKLQRSIYNQLQRSHKSTLHYDHNISHESQTVDLSLSLRNINLVLTLPTTLLHIKPQAELITSLDLSYSHTDDNTLATFCRCVLNLEHLQAVECRLEEVSETTPWPKGLRTINLSRNRLKKCPCGIDNLFLLAELNLSGNRIENFDPSLLQLPYLEKLYLLKNPITNVPKHVCRLGVFELRQFFKVEPISLPTVPRCEHYHEPERLCGVFKAHPNLRQYLPKPQGSLDSGYDSESSRRPSCSSSASLNDTESVDMEVRVDTNFWPVFTPSCLPQGYTHSAKTKHCRVYLPDDCSVDITIEIVKDISFHPHIKAKNEFLITPVVQVAPHGLVFKRDKPAIVVLSHCTKSNEYLRVTPLCSSTNHYQTPNWTGLAETKCEVFHDCIMFETTHFSLFAAIGVLPYPTASIEISQNEGGSLFLPEVPGLEIYIPPNSLPSHGYSTITATAYYNDLPYNIEHNESAIASTCLELKPHQIQFLSPVQVGIPIPDYLAIKTEFPNAQLQLWHSSSTQDIPNDWECIENQTITLHEDINGHIATFTTTHFSFFELLWTICKYPLTQLGFGASYVFSSLPNRAKYISIRCQAFMSRPLNDLSFGLVVIAYKFGDPILELSNYPWLVADSGSKRVFLKIGELCVSLTGCFDARESFGEKLSHNHRLMEFNGEDFCLRFEFALGFNEGIQLPLPDGKILGKVRFTQWMGSNSVNHDYNIIKVNMHHACTCMYMHEVHVYYK